MLIVPTGNNITLHIFIAVLCVPVHCMVQCTYLLVTRVQVNQPPNATGKIFTLFAFSCKSLLWPPFFPGLNDRTGFLPRQQYKVLSSWPFLALGIARGVRRRGGTSSVDLSFLYFIIQTSGTNLNSMIFFISKTKNNALTVRIFYNLPHCPRLVHLARGRECFVGLS